MFSLIITIISIALVAALALATLYYGGGAFNKGSADAEASKLMLQGQQLLGAADMYYAEKNEWPSMQQLLDGNYLKAVPTAAAGIAHANAAPTEWTMPIAGMPVFLLAGDTPEETCAAMNQKGSLKQRGILRRAYTELNTQCYGEDGTYKVVFKKFGDVTSLNDATDGTVDIPGSEVVTTPVPAPNDTDWSLQPGVQVGGGGGGGGDGDDEEPPVDDPNSCPAPTATVFGVPNVIDLGNNVVGNWVSDFFTFTNNTGSDVSFTLNDYGDDWALGYWKDPLAVPGDGWSSELMFYTGNDGAEGCIPMAAGGTCGFWLDWNPVNSGFVRWDFTVQTSAGNFPMTVCGNAGAAATSAGSLDMVAHNSGHYAEIGLPHLYGSSIRVLGRDMTVISMTTSGAGFWQANNGDLYAGVYETLDQIYDREGGVWTCDVGDVITAGDSCSFDVIVDPETPGELSGTATIVLQDTEGVQYTENVPVRFYVPVPPGAGFLASDGFEGHATSTDLVGTQTDQGQVWGNGEGVAAYNAKLYQTDGGELRPYGTIGSAVIDHPLPADYFVEMELMSFMATHPGEASIVVYTRIDGYSAGAGITGDYAAVEIAKTADGNTQVRMRHAQSGVTAPSPVTIPTLQNGSRRVRVEVAGTQGRVLIGGTEVYTFPLAAPVAGTRAGVGMTSPSQGTPAAIRAFKVGAL